jgi:hypothetical protein
VGFVLYVSSKMKCGVAPWHVVMKLCVVLQADSLGRYPCFTFIRFSRAWPSQHVTLHQESMHVRSQAHAHASCPFAFLQVASRSPLLWTPVGVACRTACCLPRM